MEEFKAAAFKVLSIKWKDAKPVGDCWVVTARKGS